MFDFHLDSNDCNFHDILFNNACLEVFMVYLFVQTRDRSIFANLFLYPVSKPKLE